MSKLSLLWLAAALGTVGCAFVAGGALAQERVDRAGTVSDETRRAVEVMRRVLVREGLGVAGGTVAPLYAAAELSALGVYQQSTGRAAAEAFVVPGDGATFVLRTSDPVAPPVGNADADADATTEEPSAWDQAEAELEGRRVPTVTTVTTLRALAAVGAAYDEARVTALRARVLEQLARFGSRIPGLGDDAHLTVIVVGSTPAVRRGVRPEGAIDTVTDADGRFRVLAASAFAAAADGRSSVLTLRVAVADCRAFAAGTLDLAAFRDRAVVSAY